MLMSQKKDWAIGRRIDEQVHLSNIKNILEMGLRDFLILFF